MFGKQFANGGLNPQALFQLVSFTNPELRLVSGVQ
jgi:hypothetical protein